MRLKAPSHRAKQAHMLSVCSLILITISTFECTFSGLMAADGGVFCVCVPGITVLKMTLAQQWNDKRRPDRCHLIEFHCIAHYTSYYIHKHICISRILSVLCFSLNNKNTAQLHSFLLDSFAKQFSHIVALLQQHPSPSTRANNQQKAAE